MTSQNPDLGSTSDWLYLERKLASTNQKHYPDRVWVVTRHQCRISTRRHFARKSPVTSQNFSCFQWSQANQLLLQIIFSFQDILRTLLANGILASFVGLTPRYTVASTPFTVFMVDMKITTAINVTEFLICMTTRNPCEISVEFIRQRCTLRYLHIFQIIRSL